MISVCSRPSIGIVPCEIIYICCVQVRCAINWGYTKHDTVTLAPSPSPCTHTHWHSADHALTLTESSNHTGNLVRSVGINGLHTSFPPFTFKSYYIVPFIILKLRVDAFFDSFSESSILPIPPHTILVTVMMHSVPSLTLIFFSELSI